MGMRAVNNSNQMAIFHTSYKFPKLEKYKKEAVTTRRLP